MDKQILEMLELMNDKMDKGFTDLNNRMGTIEAKVDSLDAKVDKGLAEMTVWHGERSNESVKLLTSIDNRFDKLENEIEQLNVVTSKSVRYLKHKIMELDQEVFLLHPEQ
ncbi:hypothetical protein [Sporosarcina sp. BP05]|uniref:hypothetical protein n=1 Tax=Sporosarcina sp. BP05 TaxID=2758726 RepID=UPI0016441394|nr:hypothetical protein [Sporosarcina sp. BP05]